MFVKVLQFDKCRPPLGIADFEKASRQLEQVGYYISIERDGLAASACSLSDAQRRVRSAFAGHALAPQRTARAIELTQDVAHDFQRLFRRAGIITRGA